MTVGVSIILQERVFTTQPKCGNRSGSTRKDVEDESSGKRPLKRGLS